MNKETIKKIKSNSFLLKLLESLLLKASFVVFNLAFLIIVSRIYGAEILGEYSYIYNLMFLLSIISKLGMDNSLIYFIPKYKNKYMLSSFTLCIMLSLGISVGTYFLINESTKAIPFILLISIEQMFFGIYRAEIKLKEFSIIRSFIGLFSKIIFAVVFYFYLGKRPENLIYATTLSLLISNLIFYLKKKSLFEVFYMDKKFLKYSFLMLISSTLGILMSKVDILMLGNMATKKSVGLYQVVSQISEALSMINIVFITVFTSKASQMFHANEIEKLKKLYIKSTKVLLLVAILAFAAIVLLRTFILGLFGNEFLGGSSALFYRVLGQVFTCIFGSSWYLLSMTGNPQYQMVGNLIALTINVILNYLLIPSLDLDGAALASFISITFVNILGYLIVKKKFDLKVFKIF